jgi:hypothetical protein
MDPERPSAPVAAPSREAIMLARTHGRPPVGTGWAYRAVRVGSPSAAGTTAGVDPVGRSTSRIGSDDGDGTIRAG